VKNPFFTALILLAAFAMSALAAVGMLVHADKSDFRTAVVFAIIMLTGVLVIIVALKDED